MNHPSRFSDLSAGDRLIAIGYIAGAVSTLLVSLGSILKLLGSLPEATISYANQTTAGPRPIGGGKGHGYFDIGQ